MQTQFKVEGMTCQHCVRAVREAIEAVDPAAQVDIELASGRVAVDSSAGREPLRQAIVDAGYRAG